MQSEPERPKILIVDDSASDIQLLWRELQEQYEVFVAKDGDEALRRVAATPPDLILLDVFMPGIDGYALCRRLKSDPATRDISIIFITGSLSEQQETDGLALGAVDYITKPYRPAVVRARVESALRLRREIRLRSELARDLIALNDQLEERVRMQVAQLFAINRELAASEELLRVILENIQDLIFITDDNGSFTFVCDSAESLIGYTPEEIMAMQHVQTLLGRQLVRADELRALGSIVDIEVPVADKAGVQRTLLINVKQVAIREGTQLWTCRDISGHKQLEQQIRQGQKMESIGTLAGGIAHDFNNILSAIVGYTEIAAQGLDRKSGRFGHLTRVMEACNRAKDLVTQILLFSRETEQERRPVCMASLVKEALRLIRASVPSTIEIAQEVCTDRMVLADPTQIHQLVMNLCTNAAHAMREGNGTLTVLLDLMRVEQGTCRGVAAGDHVRLRVIDTGHGIAENIMSRIFDPFFTTKEKGEGTGMGLSVVHGVVKGLGGTIKVESESGRGTMFTVLLPALERNQSSEEQAVRLVAGGTETVLLVDDEEMIVDIGSKMLESLGYRVVATDSAIKALELFSRDPEVIDLVVTDMTMPRMTGLELAQRLQQVRPGVPVLLCSGFSAGIDLDTVSDYGVSGVIFKPILRKDLAAAVREVLDRSR